MAGYAFGQTKCSPKYMLFANVIPCDFYFLGLQEINHIMADYRLAIFVPIKGYAHEEFGPNRSLSRGNTLQ